MSGGDGSGWSGWSGGSGGSDWSGGSDRSGGTGGSTAWSRDASAWDATEKDVYRALRDALESPRYDRPGGRLADQDDPIHPRPDD